VLGSKESILIQLVRMAELVVLFTRKRFDVAERRKKCSPGEATHFSD